VITAGWPGHALPPEEGRTMNSNRTVIWVSVVILLVVGLGTYALTTASHEPRNNDAIANTLPAPTPAR
jgi:hypothetical protein